jgi:hypothetical protein
MMRISLLLFALFLLFTDVEAQFSINGNRIPQQIIGGVAGGAIGGVAGGLTGRLLVGKDDTGWEALGAVVAGTFIGYTVGNGYGVYRFGNSATEKGSLAWTLVGSTVGLVAGVGIGADMGEALLPFAATSVLVGSMVGYNLTRTTSVAFLQPSTTSGLALIRVNF